MSEHRCKQSDKVMDLKPGERCWRCREVQERTTEDILASYRGLTFTHILVGVGLFACVCALLAAAQQSSWENGRKYEACIRSGGTRVEHGRCVSIATETTVIDAPVAPSPPKTTP